MFKLGLCCGGGACCLLVGTLWMGGGQAVERAIDAVAETSTKSAGCAKAKNDVQLTEVEQEAAAYLAGLIESGKLAQATEEQLEQDLGLTREAIAELDQENLRAGVFALLLERGFDVSKLGVGNCSRFSACSVDRNLNLASGDELARYEAEVALDGTTFDDWTAPDFELPTTDGDKVSLSDYRGSKVAKVLLSSHCYHSLDTLPILAELQAKHSEVVFLPVFINSGSVEDVAARAFELDVDYRLLVSEDKAISESYDSRMVPSTFLIDDRGRVTRRLVGFKDRSALDEAIGELARS